MPPTMPDDSTTESSASRRSIPGFCGLCKSRCGSRMVVEDGRLVAQSQGTQSVQLRFETSGPQQLVAIDALGRYASLRVRVLD